MTLMQIKYFHEACCLNSISRAAESLHVSQPSVSMAIKELEREFNVSLISRCYKGFTLTDAGIQFKNMTSDLLRHADHVSERMLSLNRSKKHIRLGSPPMIATIMLPAIYGEVQSIYPNVDFSTEEMGSKTCLRNLREQSLDMAFIVHEKPLPSEFEAIQISSTEIVWCCAPNHPMAQKGSVKLADLYAEPLVLFQSGFSLWSQVAIRFKEAAVEPHIVHTTSQLSTVQSLIQSGVVSGFMFRFAAMATHNISIFSIDTPIMLKISLAWLKGTRPLKSINRFADICTERFLCL